MITASCTRSQTYDHGNSARITRAGSIHDPESRGSVAALAKSQLRLPWAVKDSIDGAYQDSSPAAMHESEDDGSVPEKHISRWHNEGGSLGPAD